MDFSFFLTGLGVISLVCLVLGLVFVIIEMLHPGLSAPGIVGGILLVVGVIVYARSLLQALILIVILLVILGVALALVLQSATKGRLGRHLVLHEVLDDNGNHSIEGLHNYVEREGKTLTDLRPSGTADFNGVRLDVISDGDFIPRDTYVKVVSVEGRRIVVNRMENL